MNLGAYRWHKHIVKCIIFHILERMSEFCEYVRVRRVCVCIYISMYNGEDKVVEFANDNRKNAMAL